MQQALSRALTVLLLSLALAAGLFAQVSSPSSEKQEEQELGPATRGTKSDAADAVKTEPELPKVSAAAPVDPKTYVIGPEDILLVRVWREPELSSGAQVRPDGKITLPLIGDVQAAGNTPQQLTEDIEKSLTDFVNKPEVIVSVQAVLSKKYHITGQVNRPGTFPLVIPITVLEALSNAGGFRDFANAKKITILRNGEVIKFNYREVIKGKKMQQNINVEDGDFIVVP